MNRRNIKRLEQLETILRPTQHKGMTVSVMDPISGRLGDFSEYTELAGGGPITFHIDLPPPPGPHHRSPTFM